MFNEEAFHVHMWVLSVVVWMSWVCGGSVLGRGGGWEYSSSGALYFSASSSSLPGRKGNAIFIVWMSVGSLF